MFDVVLVDVEALAAMAPGPALASVLDQLDTTTLNGYQRVVVMQAWHRQAAWASARMYDAMSHVARSPECLADSPPELTETFTEFASVEVGAALTLSPRVADRELAFCWQLTERLVATRDALLAGLIDVAKAKEIASETACLSDDLARQAEGLVLPDAPGLTRQQLRRRLRATVLALDPAGAEERRRASLDERRVRFGAGPDGTGDITGSQLPLAQVAAARAFVRGLAEKLHASRDDDRTLTQVEADVFLDLLQGRHLDPTGVTARVELVAPLESWLQLSEAHVEPPSTPPGPTTAPGTDGGARGASGDGTTAACATDVTAHAPGELVGFGAVSADVLAEIVQAAHGGFDYCHTVTRDGQVVYHRPSGYRPTARTRAYLRARDRTCRHPGCRRPATSCDSDHVTEHRLGGVTCPCNLATLCRRHHRAKHAGRWWWIQPEPGHFTVQSPLGHTYRRRPDLLLC